jgi:hypothetical protein
VDVYVGDVFYIVDTKALSLKTWNASAKQAPKSLARNQFIASAETTIGIEGYLYFSSEASAQSWIDAHKPLELVEGEIYTSREDTKEWIFRFGRSSYGQCDGRLRATALSMFDHKNEFSTNTLLCYKDSERTCSPSSLEEKKQLITAEVNNGYFHGL